MNEISSIFGICCTGGDRGNVHLELHDRGQGLRLVVSSPLPSSQSSFGFAGSGMCLWDFVVVGGKVSQGFGTLCTASSGFDWVCGNV